MWILAGTAAMVQLAVNVPAIAGTLESAGGYIAISALGMSKADWESKSAR